MLERLWKRYLRRKPYSPWALAAVLLWPVAGLYRLGLVLKRRFAGAPVRVGLPVISIGNITVGGSGKTPLTAHLAGRLLAEGRRVGIVSSGYGRTNPVSFVADGHAVLRMDVADTGDEVMLLAQLLPEAIFAVDRAKWRAAQKLRADGRADLIIVDDGFQHFKLARDLDLVIYDAGLAPQLLRPFPCGLLREGHGALGRADLVVVTRSGSDPDGNEGRCRVQRYGPDGGVYEARFTLSGVISRERRLPLDHLADKSVLLFAGVGNFENLKRQAAALAGRFDDALEFSDHQRYDRVLLEQVRRTADRYRSDLVLTTLKDWVKVGDFDFGREFCYLERTMEFGPDEGRFLTAIRTKLNRAAKGS